MKWTEVWNKPFRHDAYGYIWSGNDVMVFSLDIDVDISRSFVVNLIKDISDILNGDEIENRYDGLEVKDGCDLYCEGNMIGSFRGWGHLIGGGALGLNAKEAVSLQDEMIKFVLDRLKK